MNKAIRLSSTNGKYHKYMPDRDNIYFIRKVLEEKEKGNLIGNLRLSDIAIDYYIRESETTIDIIIECIYDIY